MEMWAGDLGWVGLGWVGMGLGFGIGGLLWVVVEFRVEGLD